MIKAINRVDSASLLDVYTKLEADIQWTEYGHKGRQAGLQYKLGDDLWTSAVGKHYDNELEYSNLNPLFKDTIFEELINRFDLVRTRLMWVYPFACYSMHQDEYPRIHIPIVTNPSCYFVINEAMNKQSIQYMPINMAYWVDTRKTHTFINCSDQQRLHLVGVVES